MFRRLLHAILGTSEPDVDVTTQRRRTVRVLCRLPVECFTNGVRMYSEVLDISENGLRLQVPQKVRPRQEIEVRYLGNLRGLYVERSIRVQVVWVHKVDSDYHVGVTFADQPANLASSWLPIVLRKLFRAARMSDDRQHMRCPTDVEAGLRVVLLDDKQFQPGRLLDLSIGGALYQGPLLVPVSAPVELMLYPSPETELVLAARVVRRPGPLVRPYLLGLRFDPMLPQDSQVLLELIRQEVRRWRELYNKRSP